MRHLKKTVLLILLFRLSIYAQLPTIRVYIMAGQSNMTGTTNPLVIELPESLKDSLPNVLINVGGDVTYNWQTLHPGLGSHPTNFGPEITFGHDATTYYKGDKIAIIKYSYGGTTLNEDWRPPSSGGTTGWLYTSLINDVTNCLDTLTKNYTVQVMGMCWMQGEYDARDNAKALNYQTNLVNFITDIRDTLHLPKLPFAIGMIDNSYVWPFNNIVRQAEINVAKNTDATSVFDTHGLGTDGTHYNTQGQIELGHYFFNSINGFYSSCISCNNNELKIFPNPANHSFEVLYADIPTDCSYKITNMQGAEVQTGQLYAGCVIDVSLLSAGTYFVFITNPKITMVKKLIKL